MIKVPSPRMSWWERIYLVEVIRGLGVTIRHMVRNLVNPNGMPTVQFPEEPKALPPRMKGRHRLTKRPDGTPKCTACYCCQTVCPAACIYITAEESPNKAFEKRPKQFEIDMLRCVFCGYCVEACPEDAIRMDTGEVIVVSNRREDFIFDIDFLLNGEGKAWKGKRVGAEEAGPERPGGAGS
jgi:NADH-quinone oxidoreductase subunit I